MYYNSIDYGIFYNESFVLNFNIYLIKYILRLLNLHSSEQIINYKMNMRIIQNQLIDDKYKKH